MTDRDQMVEDRDDARSDAKRRQVLLWVAVAIAGVAILLMGRQWGVEQGKAQQGRTTAEQVLALCSGESDEARRLREGGICQQAEKTVREVPAAGQDGQVGPPGPSGPTGPRGSDSTVPGPTGPAGADSTIPGPAGQPGRPGADSNIPGEPGTPGEPGRNGVDGVGLPGVAGRDGQAGPPGPAGKDGADSTVPGPPGADGAPGAPGQQGVPGRGITAITCSADDLIATYTDGTTQTVATQSMACQQAPPTTSPTATPLSRRPSPTKAR